jgi:hypothetical protein
MFVYANEWDELFETPINELLKKYPLTLLGLVLFAVLMLMAWYDGTLAPRWLIATVCVLAPLGLLFPAYRTETSGPTLYGWHNVRR